jgi:hypothetical protein
LEWEDIILNYANEQKFWHGMRKIWWRNEGGILKIVNCKKIYSHVEQVKTLRMTKGNWSLEAAHDALTNIGKKFGKSVFLPETWYSIQDAALSQFKVSKIYTLIVPDPNNISPSSLECQIDLPKIQRLF